MVSNKEIKKFKVWLSRNTTLESKVINDTASRLKRVSSIVNINDQMSTNKVISNFESDEQYMSLSISVRSQLKRALRLYREYKTFE